MDNGLRRTLTAGVSGVAIPSRNSVHPRPMICRSVALEFPGLPGDLLRQGAPVTLGVSWALMAQARQLLEVVVVAR